MLKNWGRIALASFLVLMIGASVAFATTARVRSLANTGDYISDDSAVNRWYSTLTSFANQVNAEMGQWQGSASSLIDTRGLGWTHAIGEDGKWGTYRISLNENALDHPGFWMGNPFYQLHSPSEQGTGAFNDPTGAFVDTPMNKWDIAGGWELGENMSLGASITQSKWSAENKADELKASDSWLTFGAGFSWTNNDDMVLDLAANFGSAGGKVEDPNDVLGTGFTETEWDSKTAFDLLARVFWDWKDNVTLVPVGEFTESNYNLKGNPVFTSTGLKVTDMMLGLGLNMDVNTDNMLVFALEFMHRKAEGSDTDSISFAQKYLPTVRLALESHITSWFTSRIGAAKYLVTETSKNPDEEVRTAGWPASILPGELPVQGFDWFLGCGFTVAEWTIDLELNHETPFNIGYWLTGYTAFDAAGPVARISAAYNY